MPEGRPEMTKVRMALGSWEIGARGALGECDALGLSAAGLLSSFSRGTC